MRAWCDVASWWSPFCGIASRGQGSPHPSPCDQTGGCERHTSERELEYGRSERCHAEQRGVSQSSVTAGRDAANVWGLGGRFGAPHEPSTPEKRHGSAGALRTCGGLGAISGPPSNYDASRRPERISYSSWASSEVPRMRESEPQ